METNASHPPLIAVVGTANIDRIWQVSVLPNPGQTILAVTTRREFGGKGANQAVSAARQGSAVALIGAVGDDADGRLYLDHLAAEGIQTAHLAVARGDETGAAHVYVDPQGENSIVVHRGANERIAAAAVRRALSAGVAPRLLLTQFEAPMAAVIEALRVAAERSIRRVLNASPSQAGFPWGEVAVDVLIVNEHECAAIFGAAPPELFALSAIARRDLLQRRRVGDLIVTRGREPTMRVCAGEVQLVPTFAVKPIDTVGAGDAFAGILATRLVDNVEWERAIRHANVGAALSTLTRGAQSGMPTRAAIEGALAR